METSIEQQEAPKKEATPNYRQVRQSFLAEVESFPTEVQASFLDALSVLEHAHSGQFRKGHADRPGQRDPYSIHPVRVALILLQEAGLKDPNALKAALLHDVVEDSAGLYTMSDMETRFGPQVAKILQYLTKPLSNRELTFQQLHDYHQAFETAPPIVVEVKLADRIDNIRETLLIKMPEFQHRYLKETTEVYIPLARKHSNPMFVQQLEIATRALSELLA